MIDRRDRALLRWGDELRAGRRRRKVLILRFAAVATGIAALAATIVAPPAPRLLWNASSSAPIGLYLVSPGAAVHVGEMVIAWPPKSMRALAAERHYLPLRVPLVKRIAAGPGDRVCGFKRSTGINGRIAAVRLEHDRQGRALPSWLGCQTLKADTFLLLMTDQKESFDGRYFGPTSGSEIVGRARLLWAR